MHGIGEGKTRVYVNFAEDWREDFTVVIKRKRLPVLEAAGLDLMSLPGQRVRDAWLGRVVERPDDRDFTSGRNRDPGAFARRGLSFGKSLAQEASQMKKAGREARPCLNDRGGELP